MSASPLTTDVIPRELEILFERFGREVVRVTQDLCLAEENMTSIPLVMRDFHCLQRLDISRNLFCVLPVTLMKEYFPVLQELDVSHNRLKDMENVQQLGTMPSLAKLNLLGNPLVTVNQRDALLNHLIFAGRKPGEEELRNVLGVQDDLLLEDTLPLRSNVISSESISKMLISGIPPGNIPPHTAIKFLSSTNSANARPVIYCDLNAAPVPRSTPFPRLTHLNGLVISKEDIDLAGSHPPQHLHTHDSHRARRRGGTAAARGGARAAGGESVKVKAEKETKKQGKKKKEFKVRGRKLVERLERELEELLWAHKEARVKKALQRGRCEAARAAAHEGGEGGADEVRRESSHSDAEAREPKEEEAGAREEQERVRAKMEAEDEALLGAVLQRAAQRPGAAWRLELLAKGGAGGGREEGKGGGGDGGARGSMVVKRHKQQTHPEAWWDVEGGGEVLGEEEELPTRRTVLEQGKDELKGTKSSLKKLKTIGGLGGSKWTRLGYRTALAELGKVTEGDDDERGGGGQAEVSGVEGLQLSFGDVLKAELEEQREKDTTFLEMDLPKQCRKLKIEAWMWEKKEVEGVTEEIERLFTATNIYNKMASSQGVRGGADQGLSLATHEKRAQDQKSQEQFADRLSKHQERLKVIYKGGWPGRSRGRGEKVNGAAAAEAEAEAEAEGKEERQWVTGLTKTLDRMEKHAWVGQGAGLPSGEEAGGGESGVVPRVLGRRIGKPRGFRREEMRPLSIDAILEERALPGASAEPLLLVRRENMAKVREELDALHQNFVKKELQFDEQRHDVGAALDKLIVERGFGEFGLKKVKIGGMDFDESGMMNHQKVVPQEDIGDVDDLDA